MTLPPFQLSAHIFISPFSPHITIFHCRFRDIAAVHFHFHFSASAFIDISNAIAIAFHRCHIATLSPLAATLFHAAAGYAMPPHFHFAAIIAIATPTAPLPLRHIIAIFVSLRFFR